VGNPEGIPGPSASPARTARSSAPGRSPASVAFSWERSGTSSSARSSRS